VAAFIGVISACSSKPQKFTSMVEIVQTQGFGSDPKAPTVYDLEVIFTDCPGVQRKLLRGDKAFAACAMKLNKGDKVPVEIVLTYRADRSEYRDEIVKVGDCPRVVDPKDDASYGVIQECKDVVINGAVTGVHCDRTRGAALVAKCPWFKRK
jgi:hypothetical protein